MWYKKTKMTSLTALKFRFSPRPWLGIRFVTVVVLTVVCLNSLCACFIVTSVLCTFAKSFLFRTSRMSFCCILVRVEFGVMYYITRLRQYEFVKELDYYVVFLMSFFCLDRVVLNYILGNVFKLGFCRIFFIGSFYFAVRWFWNDFKESSSWFWLVASVLFSFLVQFQGTTLSMNILLKCFIPCS